MRHLGVLVLVLPSIALAQSAPPTPAPKSEPPKNARRNDEKPKGRIVDPWARMPHPRDHMRLPDPRKAAEKATADGTVAPPEPAPAPQPPAAEPHVTSSPRAATPAAAPAPAAMPPLPPPPTPFGVTTMRFVPPPPPAAHEGLTIEAGTGIGWIHLSDRFKSVTSPGGVAGLSIGIGGWLDENLALTARLAGSSVPSEQGLVIAAFLGPSLQLWFSDSTWMGVGLGLARFGVDAKGSKNDAAIGGYAGDLRLGHTFYARGRHALNASLEVTPGRVTSTNAYGAETSLNVTSLGLLFGWQYL